jgi:hypothetical protein
LLHGALLKTALPETSNEISALDLERGALNVMRQIDLRVRTRNPIRMCRHGVVLLASGQLAGLEEK